MIRFTMRSFAVLVMSLALLSTLAAPTLAAPSGTSAAAAACENGGYLNYTDAANNSFKNVGQCTRYATQGGKLYKAPTLTAIINSWGGVIISGSGLLPGSSVSITATSPIYGTSKYPYRTPVDQDGNFYQSDLVACGWYDWVVSGTTASGHPISDGPMQNPNPLCSTAS